MDKEIIMSHEMIPTAPLLPSPDPVIAYVEPLILGSRESEEMKLLMEYKDILLQLKEEEKANIPSLSNKYVTALLKEKELFDTIILGDFYNGLRRIMDLILHFKFMHDYYCLGIFIWYGSICSGLYRNENLIKSHSTYIKGDISENCLSSRYRSIRKFIRIAEEYGLMTGLLGKLNSWKHLSKSERQEKVREHEEFVKRLEKCSGRIHHECALPKWIEND
uniref:Uncharacterized protein n=1 Tax=viral metagenome TaxID=1070528 RepID=A0A6C0LJG3_9ZZZZ